MITFQRILFPVDFSEQDQQAAPFVRAMAMRFRSEIVLMHIVGSVPAWRGAMEPGAAGPVIDLPDLMNARREHLCRYLADELAGLGMKRAIELGDPAGKIVECARQQKVDLIMMPTHGYGRFRRLLLGSVTAKVLHDTDCPVWTGVHTDQLWSHLHDRWRRFVCAVDADRRDAPLLRWAVQFAGEQGAELQVVHALHAAAPIPAGKESPALQNFLVETTRERLARLQSEAGTSLEIKIESGRAGDVVRCAAIDHNADLIVVGRGSIRGVFGRLRSQAYTIIREAPCPVVSL